MSKCVSCGFESPDGAKFCGNCGDPLPPPAPPAPPARALCSACGRENEGAAKFCGGCGKPLAFDASGPPPPPPPDQGPRVTIRPRPAKKRRGARRVLAALGVLAVLIVIGILASRNERNADPQNPIDRDRQVRKKIEFGPAALFYDPPVEEARARILGAYLVQSGFFGGKPATAQIRKREETWEFRFVVREDYDKVEGFVDSIRKFALELSRNVFDEQPVAIQLCDTTMRTIGGIGFPAPIPGWAGYLGTALAFNKATLYYLVPVTEAEAGKLGDFLVAQGVAGEKPMTFQIRKSGRRFLFRYPVIAGTVERDDYAGEAAKLAGTMSREVFGGAQVEIQWCDDGLYTLRTIKARD